MKYALVCLLRTIKLTLSFLHSLFDPSSQRSRACPWQNQQCFLDSYSGPSSNRPRVATQRQHTTFGKQSSRDQTLFSHCSRALAPSSSSKRRRRWWGDWRPRVMAIRYCSLFFAARNSTFVLENVDLWICAGTIFFGPWRFKHNRVLNCCPLCVLGLLAFISVLFCLCIFLNSLFVFFS